MYDITNPVEPRLMYELDTSEQIQWMDICDGFVAVSTENGNVSQVNAEGDEVWSHNHGSLCGWMVRSDMQGVYHGAGYVMQALIHIRKCWSLTWRQLDGAQVCVPNWKA